MRKTNNKKREEVITVNRENTSTVQGKKINISAEGIYLIGMITITLGVYFATASNFGVSMVVAPAYVISEKLGIAFGYAEYIFQSILFIAMCLLVRRFKPGYLFTIVTVVIYGAVLNGWLWLFRDVVFDTLFARIVALVLGEVLTAFGVACFFRTYVAPQSYEMFVKNVSSAFHIDINKFKICYDIGSFILSIIMCLVLFGGIKNGDTYLIGIGTVFCTVTNGVCITAAGRFLDRFFRFDPIFPKAVSHFQVDDDCQRQMNAESEN